VTRLIKGSGKVNYEYKGKRLNVRGGPQLMVRQEKLRKIDKSRNEEKHVFMIVKGRKPGGEGKE